MKAVLRAALAHAAEKAHIPSPLCNAAADTLLDGRALSGPEARQLLRASAACVVQTTVPRDLRDPVSTLLSGDVSPESVKCLALAAARHLAEHKAPSHLAEAPTACVDAAKPGAADGDAPRAALALIKAVAQHEALRALQSAPASVQALAKEAIDGNGSVSREAVRRDALRDVVHARMPAALAGVVADAISTGETLRGVLRSVAEDEVARWDPHVQSCVYAAASGAPAEEVLRLLGLAMLPVVRDVAAAAIDGTDAALGAAVVAAIASEAAVLVRPPRATS